MATPYAQGFGRHQALQHPFWFRLWLAFALALGFIGWLGAHQPGHAVDHLQPPVARALGQVGAEACPLRWLVDRRLSGSQTVSAGFGRLAQSLLGPGGHDSGIFTVQHPHTLLAKHPELGRRVMRHAAVPVKVVFGDVEHGGGSGLKTVWPGAHAVELKAGKLQHPRLGQAGG